MASYRGLYTSVESLPLLRLVPLRGFYEPWEYGHISVVALRKFTLSWCGAKDLTAVWYSTLPCLGNSTTVLVSTYRLTATYAINFLHNVGWSFTILALSSRHYCVEPLLADGRPGNVLDLFIPLALSANRDERFRARILVGIILTYIAILLVGSTLFALFSPLARDYQLITYFIMLIPALLFVAILIYYRQSANHALCANIAVAVACLLVFSGVCISGGPLLSPANYVVPIPPLLAFCVAGLAAGYCWAIAVLLIQLSLMVLGFNGFDYPFMVDVRNAQLNESIDWVIAYTAIMAIGIVYELMTDKLRLERDAQKKRYQFMATHDTLTGLPNRVLFHDRLDGAVQRSQRSGKNFALLYLDLDGFKPVNDQHGHEAGDKVLECISQRLLEQLREVDIVARYGGDEFVVILEGLSEQSAVDPVIDKLLESIREPVDIGSCMVTVDASVGVALSPLDGSKGDDLVRAADHSMYRSKRQRQAAAAE